MDKYYQYELNKAFTPSQFQISERISTVLNSIALNFFYMPIQPIGLFYNLFLILTIYFIFKWVFLRRSLRPRDLSIRYFYHVLIILKVVILLIPIGYIVFDSVLIGYPNVLTWVMLGVSILSFVPFSNFVCMKKKQKNQLNFDYLNVVERVPNEYDRLNPIT